MQHPLFRSLGLVLFLGLVVPATPASSQTTERSAEAFTVQIPSSQAAETNRRLGVDEAVQIALEQNLGVQVQRIDPQIQDVGIAQARSLWRPSFSSSFTRSSVNQPASSAISPSFTNGTVGSSMGLSQLLPWGANYTAAWNNSRLATTNIFNSFSPQLQSTLQLNYTQPLLRNFKIDQVRQQVAISRKTRELSDSQLQAVIVQTTRNVKNAYWDLVYAINNLAAQRQSLELAQQSLKDNERRVQIGTMAPIDIVSAQAEVASNQQNVITAEAAIGRAEDRLRALVFDPATPGFWNLKIEPTDTAPFQPQPIDVDAAVRNALQQRADIVQARNILQQGDVNLRYFHNQILPDVNAQVSYGSVGIGGVQLEPVNPFSLAGAGVSRTVLSERGYGSVVSDLFRNTNPQWSVGVQFAYPLGETTAQANLARARLQYQQAQTQLKDLELQVITQVRDQVRQVQTNQQRVASARASRELQERKLEAEEKKFAAGTSTSFFVFQAQRDLAQARTTEIQAISDYNKSLVDLEAVQAVSLTGSGAGVTTAGSGALQTVSSSATVQTTSTSSARAGQ